jgi:hypothetical protein
MTKFASTLPQTNVQLLARARELGWSQQEVERLARGYECALVLFAGQFRAAGVPFVHHLVRSSAIALEAGANPKEVTAALLHSAYTHGDFGDGRRRTGERRRAEVRCAIGEEAERLVHQYALGAGGPELGLIRLSNDLEDCLDGGLVHGRRFSRDEAERFLAEREATAARGGWPELEASFRELRIGWEGDVGMPSDAPRPDFLERAGAVRLGDHRSSFRLAPRSTRPRLRERAAHLLRGLVERLRAH